MTPSQTRAMRAKQLLVSGRDAHEVAKEMGYTKVSAMLGAITLCSRKIERDEEKLDDLFGKTLTITKKEVEPDGLRAQIVIVDEMSTIKPMPMVTAKANAKIYPMENGIMKIGGELGYVTIKPDVGTVHLNVPTTRGGSRWLMLNGRQLGRDKLITALKEIAGAIGETLGLIEEGIIDVDHHA